MITQEKNIEIKRIPVRVKNIRKQFKETEALKNVSIEIPAGKFFTFLGPSGCGKTTLLRIISGFETSTSGDIFIGDKNVNEVPPWSRDIGFVFQNYALWPHMSIFDNISYGLKLRKISADEIRLKVKDGLKRVGLEGMGDRFPGQLSGGQQQRVAIARGLVLEPQILLLDEPLSNLDAKLRIEMRTELRRLQRDIGITTLYVTHDQEEALEISDSIAVMSNGVVEQIGTPIDIYERPASRFVANFIGAVSIIDGKGGDNGEFILNDGKVFNIKLDSKYRNKPVSIAVRPEDVEIASGENKTVDASVVSSSYLGNKRISVFEISEGVRIKAEHRTAIEVDSKNISLSVRKYNVFE